MKQLIVGLGEALCDKQSLLVHHRAFFLQEDNPTMPLRGQRLTVSYLFYLLFIFGIYEKR